jgi:P-type conjugative transfer protein TrbJ
MDVEALGSKYQQWSEDTNSSVLTTLKAAGLHSGQIEGSEGVLFKQLESMATSAEGRMQALQVANQIALTAARQTQKLRQIMLTQ